MKLAFVSLVLFSVNSFAQYQISKVIGVNDLVTVSADASNIPLKYKSLVNAFGLMSMGCTATHIGNGYVLTAGHCFYASDVLAKDLPCPDTSIEWGVRDGISPYMKSSCERIIAAQRNKQNDFAIIKVSPIPTAAVGVDIKRKALAGDTLTVFSHPEELPLQWSKTCVVEAQLNPLLPPLTLQHKCDTNPGSSGATLINADTLFVVGIHDGGRLDVGTDGMNYGTFLTNTEVADTLKAVGF